MRSLFSKRKLDAEMDEEMRSHVELRTQANIEAGMDPEEARRAASKEFGWRESIKEECRDARGFRWLEQFLQDLRFGIRMLAKSPSFTVVAIVALGLGTGANMTIFSIINALQFKPVQARHPEQLAGVYQHEKKNPQSFSLFSYEDFKDLRHASADVFTELFAFNLAQVGVRGDQAGRVLAAFVSANYFTALGVEPAMGRTLTPDEETSGAAVAVLTDAYWRQLGGDPNIVGHKLKVTQGEVTVIGVMPKGFSGAQTESPAIFFPLGWLPLFNATPDGVPSRVLTDRSDRRFMLMARLRPGLTLATATERLKVVADQLAIPDPTDPKPRTLICTVPSRFDFSPEPNPTVHGLPLLAGFASGLSGLVLLVACLNLANMMIARGAARQKEIAIRLAVGAGRGRVLRQLLAEGLLLAFLGGAAGLLVSVWANSLLVRLIYSGAGMTSDFPRFDLSPDWRAFEVLILISGGATLFFALAPAWKLARLDFNEDLKRARGEGGGSRSSGRLRMREFLAVGQLAITLALMVAAVGFSRSAINAATANPGFEFGSNFYLGMDLGISGYPETRVRELTRRATEELASLNGVESVSVALNIPFGPATWERDVQLGGAPPPTDHAQNLAEGKPAQATFNVVGKDYFRTLGIPLQQGRDFEQREVETTNAPRVAVISRTLADQLWPGQESLGRTVQFPSNPGTKPEAMTVVGVVPAIHWGLFYKGPRAQIYVPLGQANETDLKIHVRVAPGANAAAVMTAAREQLRRLDPEVPLTEVKTLEMLHQDGPWMRIIRMGSLLFGAFGALAIFLSLLGVYGLEAYAMARRTREIGIRMALGALRSQVMGMILRESLWLVLFGLVLGIPCALAVAKFAAPYLYNVPTLDVLTLAAVSFGLIAVVILVCWFPARRATRINPTEALRHE